jgi:hypothetical protein
MNNTLSVIFALSEANAALYGTPKLLPRSKEEQEALGELVSEPFILSEAELDEMARIDHAKRHHFPAPHEL